MDFNSNRQNFTSNKAREISLDLMFGNQGSGIVSITENNSGFSLIKNIYWE